MAFSAVLDPSGCWPLNSASRRTAIEAFYREAQGSLDREKLREAAQRLAERGQFDLALVEYGRLVASDPTDTRALLVSGDLQVRTSDFAAAIATYDSVARLYAEQGYADKAVAVYYQVRQLLTQHRADLLPHYAHVLEHLLALLRDLGRPQEALALLDDEANRLRAAGAELEAIEVYRRMTQVAAHTPMPHLRLAEALCRTGNVDQALDAFWAAAEVLLNAGRRDDALRVIERMLHFKQEPKYARIAAELYLEKGDVPEAMQALSRLQICFQADSTDLTTLGLLARAFLLIHQEDKAIEVQKELARQAHEQGDKELFRTTVAELRARAPSDDQVHALSQLPPPPDEPDRRAPPKRPASSAAAAAVSSIPPDPSVRPTNAGRAPPRLSRTRPGAPARPTSRVPRVLAQEQRPVSRPAAEPSRPPIPRSSLAPATIASDHPSSDIPVSLHSLLPSEAPDQETSEATAGATDRAPPLDEHEELALIEKALKDAATYRELGLAERASDVLRQALAVTPHSIPLREHLRDLLAEAGDHNGAIEEMLLMAEVYRAHDRPDHAQTVLLNVLELEPGHGRATDLLRELQSPAPQPPPPAQPVSEVASAPSRPAPPSKPQRSQSSASRPDTRQPSAPFRSRPEPTRNEPSSPSGARASMLPPMPSLPPLRSAPSAGQTLDQVLEQAETLAARGQFEHAENLLREELSRLPGHPLLLEALEEIRDDLTVASRPPGSSPDRPSFDSLAPGLRRSSFPASPGSLLAPNASNGIALQVQLSELEAAVRDSQNPPAALPVPSNLDVDLLFEQFKEGVKAQVSENDSATHYDLGLAYKEMHLLDDAIEELQLAARDPARESICFSTIALIYCEQEMYAKALEYYQRGLQSPNRLPDQDITLYYEIGNVNELSGQPDVALEYFEEVVSRNPNFRDVRDRIAKLKRQLRQSTLPNSRNNDEDVDRAFAELLGD